MSTLLPDVSQLYSLAGRRAFVTGGTRGIGWSVVCHLAAAGAEVVFSGRDQRLLQDRERQLRQVGIRAHACVYDVTDEAATVATLDRHTRGGLDILVNNAGITDHAALTETSTDAWETILATNLTQAFVHARQVAPALMRSEQGRIINIGSLWSTMGKPEIHAYAASKHGIHGLTKTLAAELGEHRVTVNTVAPGYIRTPMNETRVEDASFDALVRQRAVLGRWGEPEDIAAAVLYLASPAASYVTGQLLSVDGGTTGIF